MGLAVPPSPRARRIAKRAGVAVLLLVVAALAVPAYYWAKFTLFSRKYDVVSIKEAPSYQAQPLVDRAWHLPVAELYRKSLVFQPNESFCGPTTLANANLSFGRAATPNAMVEGTGKCWTGLCMGGLSLDDVAALARAKVPGKVTVLRGLDYAAFQALLPRFNDPSRRYLVNFHRGPLFGSGGGHHSPIGGYLEPEGLVFVLDVNEKYQPWLVDPKRLFEAIDTEARPGLKRGLLLVEP